MLVGGGISFSGGVFTISNSHGFMVDSEGTLAWYDTYGGGCAVGSGFSGGLQLGGSNAKTVYGMGGVFIQSGAGGGGGGSFSIDAYGNSTGSINGGQINIGGGFGGSVSVQVTNTIITPLTIQLGPLSCTGIDEPDWNISGFNDASFFEQLCR
jgi:hypothetical protein